MLKQPLARSDLWRTAVSPWLPFLQLLSSRTVRRTPSRKILRSSYHRVHNVYIVMFSKVWKAKDRPRRLHHPIHRRSDVYSSTKQRTTFWPLMIYTATLQKPTSFPYTSSRMTNTSKHCLKNCAYHVLCKHSSQRGLLRESGAIKISRARSLELSLGLLIPTRMKPWLTKCPMSCSGVILQTGLPRIGGE